MRRSNLSRKLTRYFSVALLAVGVVIGLAFFLLFRSLTISGREEEMQKQVLILAEALSGGEDGSFSEGMPGRGAYIRFMRDVVGTDVYLIDRDLTVLSQNLGQGMMQHEEVSSTLPEDIEPLAERVFAGEAVAGEESGSTLFAATLTVGAPIRDDDGAVWGAVLLRSPVNQTNDAVFSGLIVLGASVFFGLLAGVGLSVALSESFTRPLRVMKGAAMQLAEGNYSTRCHIGTKDEIGELSDTLDILAGRLEEARQQSDKLDQLRKDYVANVSHELKTPVTVLRASLEALRDGVVVEPAKVSSYYEQMFAETKLLQRLVDDLLELSRLQNPDYVIAMEPVDLCVLLCEAEQSAARMADEKKIRVTSEISRPCLTIAGDAQRLRQMLLTVLDNAVKFAPMGGNVRIRATDSTIEILDDGPGIPPEKLPHIFERFYSSREERNQSGTGLGLAIAKEIADRHDIRLTAENPESGGARFIFDLKNTHNVPSPE